MGKEGPRKLLPAAVRIGEIQEELRGGPQTAVQMGIPLGSPQYAVFVSHRVGELTHFAMNSYASPFYRERAVREIQAQHLGRIIAPFMLNYPIPNGILDPDLAFVAEAVAMYEFADMLIRTAPSVDSQEGFNELRAEREELRQWAGHYNQYHEARSYHEVLGLVMGEDAANRVRALIVEHSDQ